MLKIIWHDRAAREGKGLVLKLVRFNSFNDEHPKNM